jgi:hypothetical protein
VPAAEEAPIVAAGRECRAQRVVDPQRRIDVAAGSAARKRNAQG